MFFFAFSMKVARVFLDFDGTITVSLDAVKVCGSIGNKTYL
jgi:hypothetical protein